MSESTINSPKQEYTRILNDEISANLDKILTSRLPVWRRNKENKLVTIPLENLQTYLGEADSNSVELYTVKDWKERIEEKPQQAKPQEGAPKKNPMKDVEKYGKVNEQIEEFNNLSIVEREEILDKSIENLSKEEGSGRFDVTSVASMIDVIAKTFYANNANLKDNVTTDNVKDNLFGVLQKTNWIVQIIIDNFKNISQDYKKIQVLDQISTGSVTFDHINRVFLSFVAFCVFYDNYIDQGLITKNIRGAFKNKYASFYESKIPDTRVTLELVFKNGVSRINVEKKLINYAIGVLLFDMGKIYDIDFHDGEGEYNEMLVKKHVLYSYNMAIKAQQYPFEVIAISAFHHEYYGGHGSYNFTNPLLSKLTGNKKDDKYSKYFISYDEKDFINRDAFAYFPCKVLEIIDVFDALVYKQKKSVPEALMIMKKDFIAKNLKLDPVLFRIFMEFKLRCGELLKSDFEDIDEVKY